MGETPAIAVDQVSKRFRLYKERAGSVKELFTKRASARHEEFWAVRDVSLEVPHGSVYGLVGHNGSGKSTLLKMMAGIHKPTSGSIRSDGRISALLELGAGFHPDLSGRENIYLNAAILGLHKREVDAIFDDIVDFSGLGSFVDSPVKHYSSGMFVRLGFSVAVHVNPQILIIDEVIAVGDEEFQRRCFEHLYKLRNNGVTIVMVSHSLPLIQSMCDQAAWLDHGEVMSVGNGADVVHEYLNKVNAAEAERLTEEDRRREQERRSAEAMARPVGAPAERPIVLDAIEVFGATEEDVRLVTSLAPVTFRIHFRCRTPLEAPLFSFTCESQSGIPLAHIGMQPTHQPSPAYVGEGHIDYTIPALPLGPGEYTFTFAVHDHQGTMVLDKRDRAVTLRVEDGQEPVFGFVDLLGAWTDIGGATEEIA